MKIFIYRFGPEKSANQKLGDFGGCKMYIGLGFSLCFHKLNKMSGYIFDKKTTVRNICNYFNKADCAFECLCPEFQNLTKNPNPCLEDSIEQGFSKCLPDKTIENLNYVVFAGWTLLLIVSLVCGGKFLRNVYMREGHLQTATFEIIENLSIDKEWYFYRFRIDKYF